MKKYIYIALICLFPIVVYSESIQNPPKFTDIKEQTPQLNDYLDSLWKKVNTLDIATGLTTAPIGATYITRTPNATLTSEQSLSSLSTGLMKVTNGTGVVSSITDSSSNWDSAYTHSLVASGNPHNVTLQEAFDGGQTITIADTDNQTLTITNNDATNKQDTLDIVNNTAGTGVYLNQAVDLDDNEHGLFVYSNAVLAGSGNTLVNIHVDNSSSGIEALKVSQDGTVEAIELNQNGTGRGMSLNNNGGNDGLDIVQQADLNLGQHALKVLSNVTQTADSLVYFKQDDASSTQSVLELEHDGPGYCLYMQQDGDADAMRIINNNSSSGLYIEQNAVCDAISAALEVVSGTAQTTNPLVLLYSLQADTKPLLQLNSDGSSTGYVFYSKNDGTGTQAYVEQIGALAASKNAFYVYSNTAQTNNNSFLANFTSNNSSSTHDVVYIQNAGTGNSLRIYHAGTTTDPAVSLELTSACNAAHINMSGDPVNSSPIDGDLWFDGTNLNFRINATTYIIQMTEA